MPPPYMARKNWALMVGLIEEGQKVHVGKEAGLAQWNEAIAHMSEPWVVHFRPGMPTSSKKM